METFAWQNRVVKQSGGNAFRVAQEVGSVFTELKQRGTRWPKGDKMGYTYKHGTI
jgi:hypothetical protein